MNKKCWKSQKLQKWLKKYSFFVSLFVFSFLGISVIKFVGCGTTQFQYVPGGSDNTNEICSDPLAVCCVYPKVPNEDGTRCVTSRSWSPREGDEPMYTPRDNNGNPPDYTIRDTEEEGSNDFVNEGSHDRREGPSRTTVSKEVRLGKVDILFVVDNSSSMHEEHKNIQNQFDDFMNDIRDLDYRIALTTVDISSSPGNRDREYQDGRFIQFEDRSIFLHNDEEDSRERRKRHRQNVQYFKESIVREETRRCETEGQSNCPTDERGICAVNRSLGRSRESAFFRTDPDVHLMIVIISDEDERSSQSYINFKGRDEYGFESCDEPETLHTTIYNRLGSVKSYSVHSIIIPPGDVRCLEEQSDEKGTGYYGETYAGLSHPSGRIYGQFSRSL